MQGTCVSLYDALQKTLYEKKNVQNVNKERKK